MAEISADLVYEVLRSVQHDISQIKGEVRDVKIELNAIRGHLISVQQDIHNIYGILGRHDARFEHIERRLDLNETPPLSA
ncbi:MAG TPA: hypothetical protein VGC77_01370 [Rhodopseudomonas sp.]|uniref:hypothetical protein n=1 Tax=Rhodopseudomonas sp. TaxID=1078 RepID=UPI002EDA6E66